VLESVFDSDNKLRINVRIGVHCGDVVAGVVGKKQPVRVSAC
jgi:class 3 adenylate cyclase